MLKNIIPITLKSYHIIPYIISIYHSIIFYVTSRSKLKKYSTFFSGEILLYSL